MLICIECVDEICRELRWSLAELSDNELLIESSSSRCNTLCIPFSVVVILPRRPLVKIAASSCDSHQAVIILCCYTPVTLVWRHTSSCRGSAKFFSGNWFYVSCASVNLPFEKRRTWLSRCRNMVPKNLAKLEKILTNWSCRPEILREEAFRENPCFH